MNQMTREELQRHVNDLQTASVNVQATKKLVTTKKVAPKKPKPNPKDLIKDLL